MDKLFHNVIYPIPPSFIGKNLNTREISLYIKYLYKNGARTILTTAGTSRFNLLSSKEILKLNNTCSKFKGNVILGIPPIANCYLKPFINQINKLKPTAALAIYPDRYYGDDAIIDYFMYIADRIMVPLMIHGMPMRDAINGGNYNFTPNLIDSLKMHPNIRGMKEESTTLEIAYKISRLANDNFLVFPAGGSCRRFLTTGPAGAQTFLGGIGNIYPEIEETFLSAFKAGNFTIAYKIITEYEEPLFEVFNKIGWHKALQIALNHKGLLKTDNREPFSEATEKQKAAIGKILYTLEGKWENERILL